MSVSVINKKSCAYSQPTDIAHVKQLVIVEENGERFVIVKLCNGRGERLNSVTFGIVAYDEAGRVIGKSKEKADAICPPNNTVVCDKRLPVPSGTVDCKVTVSSATYGEYTYRMSGGKVAVDFAEKKEVNQKQISTDNKTDKDVISVTARRDKTPVAITVVLILALIFAVAAIFGFLVYFKATEKTFLHAGVEYAFIDQEARDGDVKVVGYRGKSARVVIPADIDGHEVKSLDARAFAGNTAVTCIDFEGEIAISEYAFDGCKNLKSVGFGNITQIGEGAFRSCISLENVTITDKIDVISLGAFYGCVNLKSVVVEESETPLKLGRLVFSQCVIDSVDFARPIDFSFCNGMRNYFESSVVDELHLLSFDVSGRASEINIFNVFGASGKVGSLTIDSLQFIPDNFCASLDIEKFEVGSLESATVGESAFNGCINLAEFVSPTPITSIGNCAFMNSSLTEFDLTAVEGLGTKCFAANGKLASVDFTDNDVLTAIGEAAFYECSALERVTIPSAVLSIEQDAFKGCGGLKLLNFEQGSELVRIQQGAFTDCSGLSEIELDCNRLIEIGDSAFENCENVTSINLPDGVVDIGDCAFAKTAVVDITLPDSVKSVGMGAFAGCPLISFTAPFVGESRDGDGGLSHIFDEPSHIGYDTVPDTLKLVVVTDSEVLCDGAFYGCDSITDFVLSDGLTSIGEHAFGGCTGITELDIPSTVTAIGDYAFVGCTGFTEFVVEDNIKSLGRGVFSACDNLTSLTLPFVGMSDGNGTIGYLFGWNGNASEAVPSALKNITVTGGTSLPEDAFYGCESVENITLPEKGITSVGNYAFYDCSSLTSLVIPNSVTYFGTNVFFGCSSLESLSVPFVGTERPIGTEYYWNMDMYYLGARELTELKKVTVTDSEYIQASAFMNCRYLEQIVLDCEIKGIDASAFDGSYKLYEVFDYSGNSLAIDGYNILAVHTDRDEKALTTIVSGDNKYVLADGEYYLIDCATDKEDLVFESSVSVGEHEFTRYSLFSGLLYGNRNLRSVTIPKNVTAIGGHAFDGCANLKNANLANGVNTIYEYAFGSCDRLKSFTLPSSVTEIQDSAFYGCYRLFEVYDLGSLDITVGATDNGGVARYASAVFANTNDGLDKTTVSGVEYYKLNMDETSWWAVDVVDENATSLTLLPFTYGGERVDKFGIYRNPISYWHESIFDGMREVTALRLGAVTEEITDEFSTFTQLESVEISSGGYDGIRIGDRAFSGKWRLKSFTATATITEIGESAFSNSGEFTFNAGKVGVIGDNAFSNSSIKSFVASDVGTVGDYAFKGCGQLTAVDFGTVGSIGDNAFGECVNLESFDNDGYIGSIGEYAFSGSGLKSLSLGRVDEIGGFAFVNLRASLQFNGDIGTIGAYAFAFNNAIESLSFGGAVQQIERYAFYNCYTLESVVLPEGLTTIGESAFEACQSLGFVSFPSTVVRVSATAFSNNYRILSVVDKSGQITAEHFTVAPVVLGDKEISLTYDKVTEDGVTYSFVGDGKAWTLYDIESAYDSAKLPEKPTLNGSEVTSYAVRGYALMNGGSLSSVVFGKSVSSVAIRAFGYYAPTVFFLGTEAEWGGVAGNENYYAYLYSACIHESGTRLWRYEYGQPTVSLTRFDESDYTVTKEPTCLTAGEKEIICPECNRKLTEEIEPIAHDFVNDECRFCKLKREVVTEDNFGTLSCASVDNDGAFAVSDDGTISACSASTLTITLKRDARVEFGFMVNGNYNDRITVSIDGVEYSSCNGYNYYYTYFSSELVADTEITITFTTFGNYGYITANIINLTFYYGGNDA
ncbi:MAG: leucine-rich repeat domain-containing protein [Clostridiales bacterium]|nr:leucine-rich repeat domain-containing protein [Clostridiales bacterium]